MLTHTQTQRHTCPEVHPHPFAHPDRLVRTGTKTCGASRGTHLRTHKHPPPERHAHTDRDKKVHTHTPDKHGTSGPLAHGTAGLPQRTHRLQRGGRALLSERIDRPRERSPLYIPGDGEGRGSLICLSAITPGFIVPAPRQPPPRRAAPAPRSGGGSGLCPGPGSEGRPGGSPRSPGSPGSPRSPGFPRCPGSPRRSSAPSGPSRTVCGQGASRRTKSVDAGCGMPVRM